MTKNKKKCRATFFPSACLAEAILTIIAIVAFAPASVLAQGAGQEVEEPQIPPGTDVSNLTFAKPSPFPRSQNLEVLGHSFFGGPWLTPAAQAGGLGAGLQPPRVHNGIAYLGGYPP